MEKVRGMVEKLITKLEDCLGFYSARKVAVV